MVGSAGNYGEVAVSLVLLIRHVIRFFSGKACVCLGPSVWRVARRQSYDKFSRESKICYEIFG